MDLDGAKILITGGSLGIGKATAKLLVDAGANVAITGRDEDRIHRAGEETGAFSITADVSNSVDIDKTYGIFLEKYGRIDCLINNAGIGVFSNLEDSKLEDFEAVFRVNVFGAALMAKRAVPEFKKQNYGNIINIGSTASLKGFAGGGIYSASKFALRSMTECWQTELRKFNIRVVQVNPSEVKTAFGSKDRIERPEEANKLRSVEIAHTIKSVLEMDDRGMIPEVTVWATNPW